MMFKIDHTFIRDDMGQGEMFYLFQQLFDKVLVGKLFCSLFNPFISLYIYHDEYEQLWGGGNPVVLGHSQR